MRIIILLAALIFVGCTSNPTLEELEDEALRTGNWEAVEKREALLERRDGPATPNCPKGHTKYCIENGFTVECSCVVIAGR